jgi:alpha-1,3-fucosyltransferase
LENKPKIILYWNNYFNHSGMGFGIGQEPFQKAGCKVSNCIATSDRDLLKQSDAVIIHAGDYSENDLPTYRSPHQRFVFFNLETLPGMRHLPCFSRRHFYNWTMTYRRDSDIYDARPYGALRLRKDSEIMSQIPSNYSQINTSKRNKLIVWFNSHCSTHSRREDYVKKLAEFIPVDIYGKCGKFECLPRNPPRCDSRILMNYKFYLAAENSLCPDYVTEKFYRGFLNDVVQVVYGGADYSHYAPPHSYINIADFKSPKALADYLLMLDNNDALYKKYFEWKKNVEVINRPLNGWCNLCEKLNNPTQKRKSYENVAKWWYDDIPCLAGSSFINWIESMYT